MESFGLLKKGAAAGVDRVSARAYAEDLWGNVGRLVERLKRGSYRARLVRRKEIPKGRGRTRPLGIPVVEDKLLQRAASSILEAIWEPEFLSCSYGYRPGRNAQQASQDLVQELQFGCYGYVVEVDIRQYFENIDHAWMVRMLEERIDDGRFVRLIQKWLRAGVLSEDGMVRHPETGCPQGGVISPVLANVYLHYVLDLWFEKVVRRRCTMRAKMFRYADDVVFAFQRGDEAQSFFAALRGRLSKFGLELSEEKSRIVRFSRFHTGQRAASFDFLGFEYRWIVDRSGTPRVQRRTSPQRFAASVRRVREWCRSQRSVRPVVFFALLNRKLVGYYNYYGVIGNYRMLKAFCDEVERAVKKWLSRRSQKGRMSWKRVRALVRYHGLEKPRIVQSRIVQRALVTC